MALGADLDIDSQAALYKTDRPMCASAPSWNGARIIDKSLIKILQKCHDLESASSCQIARWAGPTLGHTPILQHPPTGPARSLFGNRPIRVMEVLGGFHSLHLTSSRYRHHLLCKVPFLRQSTLMSEEIQRSMRRVLEPAYEVWNRKGTESTEREIYSTS